MNYEYWRTPKAGWAWRLKAGSGQVVDQGGGYVKRSDVLQAIALAKRSRPGEPDVGQSRRYRLSFAALLAFGVAVVLFWLAADAVLPRWDSSFVTVDAAVVDTERSETRRHRIIQSTKIKFSLPDGRIFTPTIHDSSVETGATTVRIRYNVRDPKEVVEESGKSTYLFALGMLLAASVFLAGAYASSLYNGEDYFM